MNTTLIQRFHARRFANCCRLLMFASLFKACGNTTPFVLCNPLFRCSNLSLPMVVARGARGLVGFGLTKKFRLDQKLME